jgi:hypothetical protein
MADFDKHHPLSEHGSGRPKAKARAVSVAGPVETIAFQPDAEQAPKPPRRRITKKTPPQKAPAATLAPPTPEVKEVKRGRGRPRKEATPGAISKLRVIPVGASTAARRRGRPPGSLGKKKRDLIVEAELKKLAGTQL